MLQSLEGVDHRQQHIRCYGNVWRWLVW